MERINRFGEFSLPIYNKALMCEKWTVCRECSFVWNGIKCSGPPITVFLPVCVIDDGMGPYQRGFHPVYLITEIIDLKGVDHLIYLTLLKRFSWSSLAYMYTKVIWNPIHFFCGDRLKTLESDVHRRQILTSYVVCCTKRVKYFQYP